MSDFKSFAQRVHKQFDEMQKHELFVTDTDKTTIFELYLGAFNPKDNPIYRERTSYDCSCCKSFIRTVGNVVAIIDNKLVSIWDINTDDVYQPVADALSEYVKNSPIKSKFLHYEKKVGNEYNFELLDDGEQKKWNHFEVNLKDNFIKHKDRIPSAIGKNIDKTKQFKRALEEISMESIDTVIDLIKQNSIYKGQEFLALIKAFKRNKKEYTETKNKDFYVWNSKVTSYEKTIRNSVIGTLLVDISEGVDLTVAVEKYEAKVAPQNYKRPTALVTKAMIDKAQKKIEELGYMSALERRFATKEDITINNVLFANRDIKQANNIFDELKAEVKEKPKSFDKAEEISLKDFINNVLPTADKIELYFDNKHQNNLMSLIAPVHTDSKNMLKWGNNFTWSYNGEVTDSIKERVKKAGGNINGILRASLSWHNTDDYDIHCIEPDNNKICHEYKKSYTSGTLDVDTNISAETTEPVENIVWTNEHKILDGKYQIKVHNFTKRNTTDYGFELELEYNGIIHTFVYDKFISEKEYVDVVKFKLNKSKKELKIIESLPQTTATKNIWGIDTNKFHEVSMVMNSPNHWDDQEIGNKHYFFVLNNCINPNDTRGFYNEFLNNELTEHRKTFELLASRMKAKQTENQLSGLGFSTTKHDSFIVKVTGSFTRLLKVIV